MDTLKKFTGSSLFLPVVALLVLLIFNTLFVDDFLSIQLTEDGRLYGRLIDILNRSCSLIILALGMTFVIATSGIDISVGAVVAISAAVVCTDCSTSRAADSTESFILRNSSMSMDRLTSALTSAT